jgi:carbamoyltransferase
MIILGIHDAHDASASLMVDGKIVAAAQEERFTGLKGDYGYPENAINFCLKSAGIEGRDIDTVALASHGWNPILTYIKRNANFQVDDWIIEQEKYWRPKLFGKFPDKKPDYWELFGKRKDFVKDRHYNLRRLCKGYMDQGEMEKVNKARKSVIAKKLGIPDDKIQNATHEKCHKAYAFFGAYGTTGQTALVLTSEGIGDYSNGTVSIMSDLACDEKARTRDNHIGHIYKYITLLLGMRPDRDEYKTMGLAPYACERELNRSFEMFKDVLKLDDLNIVYGEKPKDLYFHFREVLQGHRFDGIAGAVQRFAEVLLCEWIKRCVERFDIHKVCFSGGVAQNVKACKAMSEVEGVEDFRVMPASGDASLSLGACYHAGWQRGLDLQPLTDVYLGPDVPEEDIEKSFREYADEKYSISRIAECDLPKIVASCLSRYFIVARCSGRMEFGHRALGNRSILAHPRDIRIIRRINEVIKRRDYWMPFAPTILADNEKYYIKNPKKLDGSFMTMAFDTTATAQNSLMAAIHPADYTVRPQVLGHGQNPEYERIISDFRNAIGISAILNTSFNLHGEPIVLGPKEAMRTFKNSSLDVLVMNNWIVKKEQKDAHNARDSQQGLEDSSRG